MSEPTMTHPQADAATATPEGDDALPPLRPVSPAVEPLFTRLHELSSPPEVVRLVLKAANEEDADAEDMRRAVEKDVALSMRLLKTVNSSFYGLRSRVSDLKTAVALLGVKQVRNLALTIVLARQFKQPRVVGNLDAGRLWDHSLCSAVVAQLVAESTDGVDPDEAYLAALVHDLGLLVIEQQLAANAPHIFVRFRTGRDWSDSEREVLSFDHAQLGAYLVWRCGIGAQTAHAVDCHHEPLTAPEAAQPLACVVASANYLVTRRGRGSIEGRRIPADEGAFDALGLTDGRLRDLWDRMHAPLESVAALTGALS